MNEGQLELKRLCGISLFSGTVMGRMRAPLVNPGGQDLALPVGCFEFSALHETIPLSAGLGEFEVAMKFLEAQLDESLPLLAAQLAAAEGRPTEDFPGHPGAGLSLFVYLAPAVGGGFEQEQQ